MRDSQLFHLTQSLFWLLVCSVQIVLLCAGELLQTSKHNLSRNQIYEVGPRIRFHAAMSCA